jgi:hypothetical protein
VSRRDRDSGRSRVLGSVRSYLEWGSRIAKEDSTPGAEPPQQSRSMRMAFDLWSYDDLSAHAAAILGRLRAGSMPCDGAWSSERLDVLERWVATGKAP